MKRLLAPLLAVTAAWSGMGIAGETLATESAFISMPWLEPAGTISTTDDQVGLDRALGLERDAGLAIGFSIAPEWMYGWDLRSSFTTLSFDRRIDAFNDFTLLGVDVDAGSSSVTSSWQARQLDVFAVMPYEGLHFGTIYELGLGARLLDSKFDLRETGSQGSTQTGSARLLDYRPIAHFGVRQPLFQGGQLQFQASGYPVSGNSMLDSSLSLILDDPESDFSLSIGYRYINYEYDNEHNVAYDVEASGFAIGLLFDLGAVQWPVKADDDADGVRNARDRCPDSAAGASVDGFGCEPDQDQDGVPNETDACPTTAPGVAVDETGCMLDSDADGVGDGRDQCPDTPAGEPVEANGCSFDEDGDGVTDAIDECPATPPGVVVDAKGCGADSDADGVADGFDQCPDTLEGLPVNAEGCAIDAAPVADCGVGGLDCAGVGDAVLLPTVQFATGRAVLTEGARETLDQVALTLQRRPDLAVEVQGHTDSVGAADDNQRLSEMRAQSVVDYLISVGVSAGRMSPVGYGDTEPMASNETASGRAQNRRVVLVVTDA